jgi:hypothetical protein
LYAFFVQWKPEIYGDDDEMMAEKRGFVVLSEEGDESGEIEILDEHFGSGNLQKDWEVNISVIFQNPKWLKIFLIPINALLF